MSGRCPKERSEDKGDLNLLPCERLFRKAIAFHENGAFYLLRKTRVTLDFNRSSFKLL